MFEVAQIRKTRLMREVEARFGEPVEVLLHRLYILENNTMRQVAETIGVRSDSTIWLWLLKFGIPTRQWMLPAGANSPSSQRDEQTE